MTIFRQPHRRHFTQVANDSIEDRRLSFKALGLLTYLLSKPDGWDSNYRHLATTHADGAEATRSGLRELERAGYLVRRKAQLPNGQWDWTIEVYERPCSGNPITDEPGTDEWITQQDATEQDAKNPPTSPPAMLELVPPPLAAERDRPMTVTFEEWWTVYPLKRGKDAARRSYKTALGKVRKATKGGDAAAILLAGAERYRDDPNREDAFTMRPTTWLNQGCWDDEPLPARGQLSVLERGLALDKARGQ